MSPWDRIREALEDPKYTWRSVKRLAIIAGGLTPTEVTDILRPRSEVVFGSNNTTGELLVRLKDRTVSAG